MIIDSSRLQIRPLYGVWKLKLQILECHADYGSRHILRPSDDRMIIPKNENPLRILILEP